MNAISLLIGELRDATDGRDRAAVIEDMRYALQLSNTWLDALTDLEKARQGMLQLQVQAVPLHPLFSRLRDDYAADFAERGLQLRVVDSHAVVQADPSVLRCLIGLLLDNAAKFTREGKVVLGCRRAGEHIRVEVWDSGLGVAEADRDKLFNTFFRLENEVRPRERGLGLGLAYALQLAEIGGDQLSVRSQLGKGSCFSLTLRAAAQEQPQADGIGSLPAQAEAASVSAKPEEGMLEKTIGAFPSALPPDPVAGATVLLLADEEAERLRSSLDLWGAEVRQISAAELPGALQAGADLLVAEQAALEASGALSALSKESKAPAVILIVDHCPDSDATEQNGSGVHCLQRPVRLARLRSLCHFALTHR